MRTEKKEKFYSYWMTSNVNKISICVAVAYASPELHVNANILSLYEYIFVLWTMYAFQVNGQCVNVCVFVCILQKLNLIFLFFTFVLWLHLGSMQTNLAHTMSSKFQFHDNLQLDFKMKFRILKTANSRQQFKCDCAPVHSLHPSLVALILLLSVLLSSAFSCSY